MYKLSPSDFRYLWEDCKHCFYRKVKQGITLPSIGLPGIFSKMNGMLQAAIQGMSLQSVNPVLPHGIIEVKEGFLRSKPIPPSNDCFISGRFDILSRLSDETFAVIDFKITDPNAEKVRKFTNQLHAYKFALENPGIGAIAKKVSQLGVVVVSPEEIAFDKGKVVFNATPSWFEIKEDMTSFLSYISDVAKLLNGPLPPPSATCLWCQYRARFT
jgi:hypothetical protein